MTLDRNFESLDSLFSNHENSINTERVPDPNFNRDVSSLETCSQVTLKSISRVSLKISFQFYT